MLPLPSNTDLPSAAVTEIASVLANDGRQRAPLRKRPDGNQSLAAAASSGRALRPHIARRQIRESHPTVHHHRVAR